MIKQKNKKGIILIAIPICVIALFVIVICASKNLRNEIAHILPSPIEATGATGVSIGTNVVANFEPSTGAVTISSTSSTGSMEREAFDSFVETCGKENIRSVTFTNQVDPPADVTSLFEDFSEMTHVNNAQYFDVSMSRSTYKMFRNCSSLVSIDVSSWDMLSIEDFSYMFSGCTNVTTLDVSNWNTERAQKMDYLFNECNNVTALEIGNWNVGNVTTLLRTFSGCKKVTTLDVSNWDTRKVRNMCAVFERCESLTSIDVENWDTSSAINMSYIFSECKNLETVNVSKWNTGGAVEIQRIFHGCSSLTEVDVSNWDVGKAYNMECMFYNCSNLRQIDVSRWNTESATNMYALFWNCNKLTEIDVSNWKTGKVTNITIMFMHCGSLRTLDVSKWDTGSVNSLLGTFENCINLPELDVSNWNTEKVQDLYHTFYSCGKLREIDVSKWNTSKVNNLNGTFAGCNELTTIDVSKWDTTNVKNMNRTFSNCRKLQSIDLTNWNTEKVTDMGEMFSGCSMLKKLDLRSFNFSNVTETTGFFTNCNGINEIWLPAYTSSEAITLPDRYRDAEKPEKANIYHTEINNTKFAEPTHLFRGVFIFFDVGMANNYVLAEYTPYTKAQYCIVEEITNMDGTEGKGIDILPITTNNYSDTINKASILWNETTLENEKGYKFAGWRSDYNNIILGVPYASRIFNKDVTYTAVFNALEVGYKVKHYQEDLRVIAEPVTLNIEPRVPFRDGYTLIETEDLTGITDTQVTPHTKNYEGFTVPNRTTVTILGDGSTIVDYYYTRSQYNVTLTKDEGIDEVRGAGTYYYDQEVNIEAKVNENYVWGNWTGTDTLNNIQTRFKMPAGNVELRANSIKTTNIEIYYIDETNNESISEKKIVEGYVGKQYEVKPIQINGYKFSSSSENTVGTMTEEPIKIYFKYLKQTGLNVKYVDINTKEEIAEAKHYDSIASEQYDVTGDYQDIDKYTFIKDSGNTTGIMINEGMDVIYYYAYNSNITVKYYDEFTKKEIGEPQIIEGYEGKEFTLEPQEIEGYKLIKIDNPEGAIERDGTEVKYYYAKEIKLTLKYIDKSTKQELKEKKEFTYYSGDTYDLEEEIKTIDGYKYADDTNIGLKGKIASEDIDIEIYYAKEIKLTIKYIDKDTKEEIEQEKVYTYYSGDKYDVEEDIKNIKEYQYIDTNMDLKGQIGSEDITIEIYYEKDKTMADIKIPQTGNRIIIIPTIIIILFGSAIMYIKYKSE